MRKVIRGRGAIVLAVTVLLSACGPHPLGVAQPTAEALAREVVAAFARGDEPRLRALALSEKEFQQRVWPALPAARPERNVPWSYVWMDLRQKSDASLKRSIRQHRGEAYELIGVRFDGKTTDHGTYRISRACVLLVRDRRGIGRELRLAGSLIETAEGWKVFSYAAE
jgi:hypothetical protein